MKKKWLPVSPNTFSGDGLGHWIGVQEAANPFFATLVKQAGCHWNPLDPGFLTVMAADMPDLRVYQPVRHEAAIPGRVLVLWFHNITTWLVIVP